MNRTKQLDNRNVVAGVGAPKGEGERVSLSGSGELAVIRA